MSRWNKKLRQIYPPILALLGLLMSLSISLSSWAKSDKPELQIEEMPADEKNPAPSFEDGKDYFSYSTPIEQDEKDKKIHIQFFFDYDCQTCVNTQDILAIYGQLNAGKVVIEDYPVATDESTFTAQTYYSLLQMKREDVSDALLFETNHGEGFQKLSQMPNLLQWLSTQQLDTDVFSQIYQSDEIKKQVQNAVVQTEKYGVFTYPFVVINGKYVLTNSTLYNDDYSFAVLDFLVQKSLQK